MSSSANPVATTVDAAGHRATIEAKIPATDITAALKLGAELPMGLFRMEGTGKRLYLAWSPPKTASPDFHVFEAFGTLIIDR